MASDLITNVTDSSFDEEVLKSATPVVVDFWATWCGPCRAIAPMLEQKATEYDSRLRICKVDVDQNQQAAGRYGVTGIPNLLLFKGGEVIGQHVGGLNPAAFDAFVAAAL